MDPISGEQILSYIPHRFENLLIDSCTRISPTDEGVIGTHQLHISKDDALGRHIFLRQKQAGNYVLLNACVAEILALSSIVIAGESDDDHIAFFSAITKFNLSGDLPADTNWTGEIKKGSEKGGFYRYYGDLTANESSASCDVMAFYMNKTQLNGDQAEVKQHDLPECKQNDPIEPFPHKDPKMMAVSHLRGLDSGGFDCICSYTYPTDHPFIKGHFPDEPVMMGVMQWMMVEDTLAVWAKKTSQNGKQHVVVDATIYTTEGQLICEIKQAECHVYSGVDDIFDQAELVATRKVAFRGRVKPGDELMICLSLRDQRVI